MADSSENELCFTRSALATGDTEDADGGNSGVLVGMAEGILWRDGNGEVGANGNEMIARRRAREPGYLFKRNGKDGKICGDQGVAHGVELQVSAKAINKAWAAERFQVMKNDGDTGTGGF